MPPGHAGPTPMLRRLLQIGLCTTALVLVSRTVPDVDLWGHLTFGHDILESRSIPTDDPYSFTSDRPWVNHEWLAEVAFAWMYDSFGPTGLILLRWGFLACLFGIVWWNMRREGTSADRALFVLALVALLTYPRTQHVRPQLVSVLAFACLLTSLKQAEHGRRAPLYAVPLLMLVWANAHGGWIVGLGTLALWAGVKTARHDSRRLGLLAGVVTVVSAAATLANPYGLHMWEFLRTTVGFGREDIVEWHPVTRAGFGVFALWSATVVLAARAMWRGKVSNVTDRILVVALGLASLRVSRLDVFFVLAVAMLCREGLLSFREVEPAGTSILPGLFLKHRSLVAAAVLPIGLFALILVPKQLTCIEMHDADWLPEPEAVEFARSAGLHGKVLTYFDWGEYAIWHLSPSIKVSMDGRRETVYSSDQVAGHLAVYADHPSGLDYVRRIAPDYVWLPTQAQVVQTLKGDGWTEAILRPALRDTLARRRRCANPRGLYLDIYLALLSWTLRLDGFDTCKSLTSCVRRDHATASHASLAQFI